MDSGSTAGVYIEEIHGLRWFQCLGQWMAFALKDADDLAVQDVQNLATSAVSVLDKPEQLPADGALI